MIIAETDLSDATNGTSDEGICGSGLAYSVDSNKVTITYLGYGTGEMFNYGPDDDRPWENCSKVSLSDGMTSIGNYAFYRMKIIEIQIPDSVREIRDYAFCECESLKIVSMSVNIESIGESAFDYCRPLYAIDLPDTLKSLGASAFEDCSLSSIKIPETLTEIPERAFCGCRISEIVIPDSITKIGLGAFSGCPMTSISIPKSVTSIESMFGPDFYSGYYTKIQTIDVDPENPNYTSVDGILFTKDMTKIVEYPCMKYGLSYTIPDCVKIIGKYAFGKSNFQQVTIPSSITYIEEGAFSFSSVRDLRIPDGIKIIPRHFAAGCWDLRSVVIPDSVERISVCAFNYTGLEFLDLPDSIRYIDDFAFATCKVTKVVLPQNLISLGAYAFEDCVNLKSITMPEGLTEIGYRAISFTKIKTVTIPESVVYIGGPIKLYDDTLTIYDYSLCGDNLGHAKVGDYELEYNELSRICKITKYNGNSYYFGQNAKLTVPATFDINGTTYETRIIGEDCFSTSLYLKTIIIPDGVLSIEYNAFYACPRLEEVILPDSIKVIGDNIFKSKHEYSINKLPKDIVRLGNMFLGCEIKEEPTIPYYMSGAENMVFSNLDKVTIPDNYLFDIMDVDGVVFTKDMKELMLFPKAKEVENYIVPDTVQSISELAFDRCTGIVTVTLPDGLKKIGSFSRSSIERISIPSEVTEIPNEAFSDCTNLKTISLGKNVSKIKNAFSGCKSIEYINIPDLLWTMNNSTFEDAVVRNMEISSYNSLFSWEDGALYGDNGTVLMSYCSDDAYNYRIPDSVSTLPNYSLMNLPYVYIPETVVDVGDYAFFYGNVMYNGKSTMVKNIDVRGKTWVNDGKNGLYSNLDGGYRIDFDPCGGYSTSRVMSTVNGRLDTFPDVQRDGYEFEGWYSEKDGGVRIYNDFDKDTTLYAHWKAVLTSMSIVGKSVASIGDVYRLSVEIEPEESQGTWEIVWKSSDPSVAKIEKDGTLTALATGETTITASLKGTDLSTTLVIDVKEKSSIGDNMLLIGAAIVGLIIIVFLAIVVRRRNSP